MTRKPTKSFDETRRHLLQDAEVAAGYLQECLADGSEELFMEALRNVAEARLGGVAALAEQTDLSRETLYRTLSKRGNPRLSTLSKVLGAVGLQMAIEPTPERAR
ncbi:MAG: addiction module antidote protein [Lacipirellulaceae bacterium]